ncbi:hypothetical protein ONZ45_g10583 [Pleurotus djamor]|nr:hypothetical protein ONZ45_g10583 [Pleurotus djamor]
MDPLALTTSIIELGLSIKETIDKFAERRSRAKELACDALVNLRYIAEFYDKNHDLYRVHKRCQIYEPKQDIHRLKRLAMPLKLWMDSDKMEADLIQLEKRIQTSMNRISLLSGARVEVRITKIESILANAYESRVRIQHFDSAFTQGLLGGDPGLGAFDRSPSELDDVDIQYINLKAMKLIGTISAVTFTSEVTRALPPMTIYTVFPMVPPAPHNIVFSIVKLQALASSENTPIEDFSQNTFNLIDMLEQLEMMDILLRILGTVENRLRQTLGLGTRKLRLPRHIKEEEEDALDYLEAILYYQNYYGLPSQCDHSAACSICDEHVKRTSEYIQFSRSLLVRRASPSNYHRIKFSDSLMPSIYYHSTRGQVEACFGYCSEALEVIQPCIASTTRKIPINHAGALQFQVSVLGWLAVAQVRDCDYTSAFHTGMACMTSLKALSNIDKSALPDNFDYMTRILEDMYEEMPTWTSVVRNPEHRTSYIEEYIDEDDAGDGSPRQIEWGIAL